MQRSLLPLALVVTALVPAATAQMLAIANCDKSRLNVQAHPYNAVGNGIANDSLAVSQALADGVSLGKVVFFPKGTYLVNDLEVTATVFLEGIPAASILRLDPGAVSPNNLLKIKNISEDESVHVFGLNFEGGDGCDEVPVRTSFSEQGLVQVNNSWNVHFNRCGVSGSAKDGLHLFNTKASSVSDSVIRGITKAGIYMNKGCGLTIQDNSISCCGIDNLSGEGNGIRISDTSPLSSTCGFEGGAIITGNDIFDIRSGPTCGPTGNGVCIYRSNNVLASSNRIDNCAYSALRSNDSAGTQFVGNTCSLSGETAVWVEATGQVQPEGFGAVVSDNTIDGAVRGISITNYLTYGGRLAACSGNVMRNIGSGIHDPVTTGCSASYCGSALSIEAQITVTGNVIEADSLVGIRAGKNQHLTEVLINDNLVRSGPLGLMEYGLAISDGWDTSTGLSGSGVLAAGNVISGTIGTTAIGIVDGSQPTCSGQLSDDDGLQHWTSANNVLVR